MNPIERIESLRPALRFRVPGGGTDTDEREVLRYMGDAGRADRYRLLVGEAAWRASVPGSGSCQTNRFVNFGMVGRIRPSHRKQRTKLS